MKTHRSREIWLSAVLVLMAGAAAICVAGDRVGGAVEMPYEGLNSGGIAYATNGNVQLGGSLGQYGFIQTGAGAAGEVQSGFWKMEDGCEMYPVTVNQITRAGDNVAITFNLMRSNWYSVAYLNTEDGGLLNGTHVWTNLVAGPVTTDGGLGSVTTIYVNASTVTNRGRFFLIRCEAP